MTRRMHALQTRKRRRRLLVLLPIVMVLIAAAAVFGSGAVFTASSFNVEVLAAGNLSHGNSSATVDPGDSSAIILDIGSWKPGDSRSDTVVLTNTGDLDGQFYLSASGLTHAEVAPYTGNLSTVLRLKVVDAASTVIYDGAITALPATGGAWGSLIDAGIIAAGASQTYTFTVSWADGGIPGGPLLGDNNYKMSSMQIQFDWSQVQL